MTVQIKMESWETNYVIALAELQLNIVTEYEQQQHTIKEDQQVSTSAPQGKPELPRVGWSLLTGIVLQLSQTNLINVTKF